MRAMIVALLLGSGLLPAVAGAQEQTRIPDYPTARHLLWSEVYARGGQTLYCGENFGRNKGRGVNVEHIFPMAWVANALGCGQRKQCRDGSERFNRIEADLHNLYPARTDINDQRSSFPFAEIKGEQRRYGNCDFEFDPRRRVVEPRPAARGEIARAMFHMAESYGLEIRRKQAEMLLRWHREDRPSKEEKRRNDIIERLQGTRNLFVDEPELADALKF